MKKPRPGDALCYHLAAVSGAALEVGRSDTCDIVLNDATVSRSHLALEEQGGGWVAATLVPDPLKSVRLRGRPLMVGEHPRLVSGDELRLGDVTLTFLEATALRARVNALQG